MHTNTHAPHSFVRETLSGAVERPAAVTLPPIRDRVHAALERALVAVRRPSPVAPALPQAAGIGRIVAEIVEHRLVSMAVYAPEGMSGDGSIVQMVRFCGEIAGPAMVTSVLRRAIAEMRAEDTTVESPVLICTADDTIRRQCLRLGFAAIGMEEYSLIRFRGGQQPLSRCDIDAARAAGMDAYIFESRDLPEESEL